MILRLAKLVRRLDFLSRFGSRFDSLLNAVMLTKRPRWVDACVLGLRATQSMVDESDALLHHELDREGAPTWPCTDLYFSALKPHFVGQFFNYVRWYRVPHDGHDIEVVLSTRHGSTVYADVDASTRAETFRTIVWSLLGGVLDLRMSGDAGVDGSPGHLYTGFPHPLAASLASEVSAGVRSSAILLGERGVGKSYVIEQAAATIAAARRGRVLRIPQATSVTASVMNGTLKQLQPDVVIVHDIDTDAPSAATLLRLAEMCRAAGAILLCTANDVSSMHSAAFGDHRLGAPILVSRRAPDEVIRAVLGDVPTPLTPEQRDVVYALPLASLSALRLRLLSGASVDAALALAADAATTRPV